MKESKKIEQLLVATLYYLIGQEIEPYEQYETFGWINYDVFIMP